MLQKTNGPTVVRHTTPGQEDSKSHRNSSSTRPVKKWVRVLAAFVRGERLHRFAAEQRVSDHTLPSTVSELQKKGVKIDRRDHTVPGYRGERAHVALYWLNVDPENVSRARALLAIEAGGTP